MIEEEKNLHEQSEKEEKKIKDEQDKVMNGWVNRNLKFLEF